MADDLWQRSAVELAEGIRGKRFSCREVVESVAGRIRALNGTLNAIVYDYTDEALAEARRADDDLAAAPQRRPRHWRRLSSNWAAVHTRRATPHSPPALP